ncbi:MAG: thioredoxin-dependent thiol peroxidase [Rectinema sp.]
MIQEGERAPDFALKDADGKMWTLADFRGKTVVLYFYPKDNTPGCTTEACGFRDRYDEFKKRSVEVVGVSADSEKSHKSFAEKKNLPFLLLSDPEKKTIEAYGALGERKLYGRTFLGILRSTFIIDGEGIVRKVFPKVTPAGHAEEILAAL